MRQTIELHAYVERDEGGDMPHWASNRVAWPTSVKIMHLCWLSKPHPSTVPAA